MVSDKEKDLYIKSNIKDGKIPHKIDELFENQLKIIGGEKMEENKMNINWYPRTYGKNEKANNRRPKAN